MRVLVTGASGFLGLVCVARLREDGHEVITTDRRGNPQHVGDLASDFFCMQLPDVDCVVHCAAVQYVSPDLPLWRRERYFEHNNVMATQSLCRRYARPDVHLINIGTSMMYDQNGSPRYGIDSAMKGQGVYSRSKLSALKFVDAHPGKSATVIPCIIGGVGREGLFRSFVSMMQRWGGVAFPGTGTSKTNAVHVEDVASLIALIVRSHNTGLFNAGAPEPLSITEWVDEMASELGLKKVWRLRIPLAPIDALSSLTGYRLLASEQLLMLGQPHVLDISSSLAIGWKPRFSNAAIVRDIARYIAANQIQV